MWCMVFVNGNPVQVPDLPEGEFGALSVIGDNQFIGIGEMNDDGVAQTETWSVLRLIK